MRPGPDSPPGAVAEFNYPSSIVPSDPHSLSMPVAIEFGQSETNRAGLSSSIAIAGDLLGHPLQGFASITLEDPVRRNIAQATDYRHKVRWVAALFTVGYGVGGFTFQIVGHGYFPASARTSTCSSFSTTNNPWAPSNSI
jgi:hypothetical protein